MTRFFSKVAYLFALFTFACGSGSSGTEAEGDAAPGSSNDSSPPFADPTLGARPTNPMVSTTPMHGDAGTISAPPVISCMAGALMMVLGCGDGGTQDLANDSGVLRDSSESPMIKQDAGPASKDTKMPNDTAPIADAGTTDTSPEARADAGPVGTTGPKDAGGASDTGNSPMDSGIDVSPVDSGNSGGGPEVTPMLVMNVVMRLKAIPAGVIFLDENAKLHVSGRVAVIRKKCFYEGLLPLFTGPGVPRSGEDAWKPWYSLWTFSHPSGYRGDYIRTAVSPITDEELQRYFPGMSFKIRIAPLSPRHTFSAFNVMSINDWVRANINNLDAAIEAVKPLDTRDCEP